MKKTRIQRSDGTWEEIVENKRGCLWWLSFAIVAPFVLALVIQYWWTVALLIVVIAIGIYGGIIKRRDEKLWRDK